MPALLKAGFPVPAASTNRTREWLSELLAPFSHPNQVATRGNSGSNPHLPPVDFIVICPLHFVLDAIAAVVTGTFDAWLSRLCTVAQGVRRSQLLGLRWGSVDTGQGGERTRSNSRVCAHNYRSARLARGSASASRRANVVRLLAETLRVRQHPIHFQQLLKLRSHAVASRWVLLRARPLVKPLHLLSTERPGEQIYVLLQVAGLVRRNAEACIVLDNPPKAHLQARTHPST